MFSDWMDMCPHTITVEPFVGVDAFGAYAYGPPTSTRCRIQGKNQLVMTLSGEEMVSHITIYVPNTTVSPQDRYTLPAPFQPTVPNILDVRHVSDESGQHHSVVLA